MIIDGNKGLRAGVEKTWVGIEVQRCTVHKLRNLERHTPRHALEQVKTDYHAIVNAKSLDEAKKAYREFVVKWKKLLPKVVASLEEAGEELLTFYRYPNSQWKSLRTTNAIERLKALVTSRSFVVGLLKKKFFRHGYRKYEFPHNQGHNQTGRKILSGPNG